MTTDQQTVTTAPGPEPACFWHMRVKTNHVPTSLGRNKPVPFPLTDAGREVPSLECMLSVLNSSLSFRGGRGGDEEALWFAPGVSQWKDANKDTWNSTHICP